MERGPLVALRPDVVRGLRHDNGWTQGDLARRIGSTRQHVSRLEHCDRWGQWRRCHLTTAERLAEVFGLTLDDVAEFDDCDGELTRLAWRLVLCPPGPADAGAWDATVEAVDRSDAIDTYLAGTDIPRSWVRSCRRMTR